MIDIQINWSNINPVKTSNFKTKTGISSWGIPYDPLSIMHYWATVSIYSKLKWYSRLCLERRISPECSQLLTKATTHINPVHASSLASKKKREQTLSMSMMNEVLVVIPSFCRS